MIWVDTIIQEILLGGIIIGVAQTVGVDSARMKWIVFLTPAFGTGIAGGLIYMQKAHISPDAAFNVTDWTAYVIFIVVIGGIGSIEGPIVGVLIFFTLQSLLADFGSWYLMTLGVPAIAVMLIAPRGPVQVCRAPPVRTLLGDAARGECRRDRHGVGADDPVVELIRILAKILVR